MASTAGLKVESALHSRNHFCQKRGIPSYFYRSTRFFFLYRTLYVRKEGPRKETGGRNLATRTWHYVEKKHVCVIPHKKEEKKIVHYLGFYSLACPYDMCVEEIVEYC